MRRFFSALCMRDCAFRALRTLFCLAAGCLVVITPCVPCLPSCVVSGYSTSETWYAVLDSGTNYCNLHNLITSFSNDAVENIVRFVYALGRFLPAVIFHLCSHVAPVICSSV